MSIWKQLVTAVRGGASEVGEAIVDSNAIRILEQEQRDADAAVLKARNSLIEIKAKHKMSLQRLEAYGSDISSWENKAMAALNKGADDLAGECANKVAEIEGLRDQEKILADQFGKQVEMLHAQVTKADSQIKGLKQQIEMTKAREAVQQARVATTTATSGASNKVGSAVDSLARIKQRQDEQDARLEAAEEMADAAKGGDLDRRLQEAGIGAKQNGGEDVLARLRAKQNNNPQ
ncbi:PspA/IM30 family protein (plasmid) [Pseudomonas cannabina pv. alisalensis]|uniref:PspA/IM30 family protein n=1 Tax=Pseudomonas syringae pv. maculicola str. ES4326 TaxID=629265 RepID=A0A8T8CB69_PSEYM|nr:MULTISPECIES: PspA/IM30 family protein [Pseudomonas syringae group]QHF00557.1 PspA/IM30 family protein [Pseudomonas syringae pv. maculicola str. ES4326]UBZ00539.1 PspA/IM30 family protein [Pseudomonas cannabina pv. alisalensis]